ncbi:unnamed protein product [Dibothriocephalus latus]|uniref:Uncharacterized protein n=1 Tax=Dibothriocephalus latus TaxID=60516 RepID=A0A3P6V3W9_DIBLA|nr:unnamed protein product [Dibothriocephalus latus]
MLVQCLICQQPGDLHNRRIKDLSGYYEGAFIFLGVAQFLGSLMALTAIVHRKYACGRPAGALGEEDLDGVVRSLLRSPDSVDADLSSEGEEEETNQKGDASIDCQLDETDNNDSTLTEVENSETEHVHRCPS